ncbi:hypothetical protein NP233_g4644 [Leucocoprinus birnbaumii]|uniref:Uncharacterized protein n=1 Tax=Leucocoprinus birnbaumii TaxID=56174 RepID=A0AAD5YRN4_9AGAR|nr:hypothetical protein NP233_g4644 [Leucocoprinus birnbaumii]
MTLENISYDTQEKDEGAEYMAQAVIKELKDKSPALEEALNPLILDTSSAKSELADFIDKITAKLVRLDDAKARHFWVISSEATPSFSDIDAYNKFMEELKKLQYATLQYGIGLPTCPHKSFGCTKCKSRDHPSNACIFPKSTPGWLQPRDEDFPWTSQAEANNAGNKRRRGGAPGNRGRATPKYHSRRN